MIKGGARDLSALKSVQTHPGARLTIY